MTAIPIQLSFDGSLLPPGPTGPQGPVGPIGPQGPQGPAGPPGSGRIGLTANTTYYVNVATGSNANSGTSASPWADPVYAYQYVQKNIDLAGFLVTVRIQGATVAVPSWVFSGPLVGAKGPGSFIITNDVVSTWTGPGTGTLMFVAGDDAALTIEGNGTNSLTVQPGVGDYVFVASNGVLYVSGLYNINTAGGHTAFDAAGPRSLLRATGPTVVSSNGGAMYALSIAEDHSQIEITGNWTMNGAPSFTTFCQSDLGGMHDFTGLLASGSAAAGAPYTAITNGIVFNPTGNPLPGPGAPIANSGGIYVT